MTNVRMTGKSAMSPKAIAFTQTEVIKNPDLWPTCETCGGPIRAWFGEDGKVLGRDRFEVWEESAIGGAGRWTGPFTVGTQRIRNAARYVFGPFSRRRHVHSTDGEPTCPKVLGYQHCDHCGGLKDPASCGFAARGALHDGACSYMMGWEGEEGKSKVVKCVPGGKRCG